MNVIRLFATIISIFAAFQASVAQHPKAELVDEFSDRLCSEDIRAKIDHFFLKLQNQPGSTGYIVGNADEQIVGRLDKSFKMFRSHANFRRFYPDRIKYFRGPNATLGKFQFWVVPDGAKAPDVELTYSQQVISAPVMFDASYIREIKNGVVEFGGNWGDEPCDFGIYIDPFVLMLGADRDLTAYLVASSKGQKERKKVLSALQITADSLVKEQGISRNRIKTIYVGAKKDSEMQLWLVPKGARYNAADFTSKIPE